MATPTEITQAQTLPTGSLPKAENKTMADPDQGLVKMLLSMTLACYIKEQISSN
jgi:hypothetical protein